jgi:hypothetical protein
VHVNIYMFFAHMIWGCNMCGLKHFASNNSRCDGLLPRYQKLGLVHDSNNDFL